MDPVIRTMTEDDLANVVAIEGRSYGIPWTEGIFRDCLKVGYNCWVMEDTEQMLGYMISSWVLDECHLFNLAIDKPFRNQGVGRSFMLHLIDFCKKNQILRIYLEVNKNNLAAQKLYKNLGFVQNGLRKDYYETPSGREDAILMECILDTIYR